MSNISSAVSTIASGIGTGLQNFAQHSANAAAAANGVSFAAQNKAAQFNASQATQANMINANSMANQYGFNSGQAAIANQFTQASWEQAAAWNEEMFERQMAFNAEQAKINRDWQEWMDSTKYQRAMKDMKAGGLNPVLAAGGISIGGGGGGAASVSSPSMSSATGQGASGGLLGANSPSIGGFTGQMEYMGGMLGLLSAAIGGIASAAQAWSQMGVDNNKTFIGLIKDIFLGQETLEDSNGKGQRGRSFSGVATSPYKNILNDQILTGKPR